ncbi:MAG: aspartate--tRNA ligase [Candidatus Bipolaricaulia bacterium]
MEKQKWRERVLSSEVSARVDERVMMAGWVHARRDHGKIIFIDLRDKDGLIQIVFVPGNEAYERAQLLKPEWVIRVTGSVKRRPERMINPKIISGTVEVQAEGLEVLIKAAPLPFSIDGDGYEIEEMLRAKYRYLDLRRSRMREIMKIRHRYHTYVRDFLNERGFIEIDTPILTKSTPEGARDFLVPSRHYPGRFYALPQSPQQYKQLLMVAGLERYYQFARCFRDEDIRKDRLFEFTQLDLEMSFVDQEEVLSLVEELVIGVSEEVIGKKIQEKPFPRIPYDEVVSVYGDDHPDLRDDPNDLERLAYAWIVDFPLFEYKEGDERLGASHHPFTAPRDDQIELLDSESLEDLLRIRAKQYDLVLNGDEIFGGSIRTHDPTVLAKVFKALGHTEEEIEEKFGHLLEAFQYGVPPHGGIAASDRFLMTLLGEKSIREVVPFPTSATGQTAVMDAPGPVTEEQLSELHLRLIGDEDEGD